MNRPAQIGDVALLRLFDPLRQQDWRDEALCAQVDPDTMFPDKKTPDDAPVVKAKEAKAVCTLCPVRAADLGGSGECLEYALTRGERFGVWGGKSERERRLIIRDRRAQTRRDARQAQAQRRKRGVA